MLVSAIVLALAVASAAAPTPAAKQSKSHAAGDATAPGSQIKNLVVLVMENRSFDSLLGRLKWDGINPAVDGLTGTESNPLNGTDVPVHRITDTISRFDPGHTVPEVTEELYGANSVFAKGREATMDGFAFNANRISNGDPYAVQEVMGAYGPDTLPVTYGLATNFTIIDNWFSSLPGPTFPNRHFVHCATACGHVENDGLVAGIECPTVFDNLDDAGISWRVYASSLQISTLLYRGMRWPWRLAKHRPFNSFIHDAKEGKLPQYTFLDPDYKYNDDHPPNDLRHGEEYLKKVYDALRSSPQWKETMLLITFDEHGGFYDHVSPPTDVPAPDDRKSSPVYGDFDYTRLGARVPTIVVSPWVAKGAVVRSDTPGRYYEHSSIPATIKKMFDLPNFLTRRDAIANTFDTLATLQEPRDDCPTTMSL